MLLLLLLLLLMMMMMMVMVHAQEFQELSGKFFADGLQEECQWREDPQCQELVRVLDEYN